MGPVVTPDIQAIAPQTSCLQNKILLNIQEFSFNRVSVQDIFLRTQLALWRQQIFSYEIKVSQLVSTGNRQEVPQGLKRLLLFFILERINKLRLLFWAKNPVPCRIKASDAKKEKEKKKE